MWRAFAEVAEPESLDGTIVGNKNTVATLTAQASVHRYSVKIDSPVTWSGEIGRNCNSSDICDSGLSNNNPEILIKAKEYSRVTLLDGLCSKLSGLDIRVNQGWVVLNNGVISKRMHKDHLGVDNDRVSNGDRKIAKVVGNDSSRDQDQAFLRIHNKTKSNFASSWKAIQFHRHRT